MKEEGAGYRVDSVRSDGTTLSVDNAGVRGDVGQCGSRILAITDTVRSESMRSAAFEAYAAQSGGSDPEALMVVVQLTDHDGDTPPVLAVAPMIDGLSSRQRMFDCEGGCHHDAERAGRTRTTPRLVVRRASGEAWFFSGGTCQRVSARSFPSSTRPGNPLELNG